MKKLKYLLLAITTLISFNLNVKAEEYSVILNEEYFDYFGEKLFDVTISSNELPSNTTIYKAGGEPGEFAFGDEEYQIYSKYLYDFPLFTEGSNDRVTDKEVEILISMDDLTEGTVYDVYYLDSTWPNVIDEENLGETAKVVKKDNKLYIRLVTSTLKPFALEKKMSAEYKKALEELMPSDNIYRFPAVKPNKTTGASFDFYSLFGAFRQDHNDIDIWPASDYEYDDDYAWMILKFNNIKNEAHVVKYKWGLDDVPAKLKNEIKDIEKNIYKNTGSLEKIGQWLDGVYFEVEDLNYINYLFNNKTDNIEGAVSYSSDLRSIFKNNNFKYYFDFRAGNGEPFQNLAFGYMQVGYDGIIYPLNFDAGYYIKQVIYIPDNTKDTDEAYIVAAKKRIADYLGTDDFKLEVVGPRSSLTNEWINYDEVWEKFYDLDNISNNYYNLTINNQTVPIVLEKNSKKIKDIEFKTKDLETNIEINSKSSRIPLDTLIEAKEITKNQKQFKEILDKLNKDNGMIFDLKLHSETLDKYITKLSDGTFEVRIPLKDEYKNKNLTAYYIKDNGEIEEHQITIKDNYAIFITDHFSTYTIAETGNEGISINNPNTYDGITTYIILGITSLIALISLFVYFRKQIND